MSHQQKAHQQQTVATIRKNKGLPATAMKELIADAHFQLPLILKELRAIPNGGERLVNATSGVESCGSLKDMQKPLNSII